MELKIVDTAPKEDAPISVTEALKHSDTLGNILDTHVNKLGNAMVSLRNGLVANLKDIEAHAKAVDDSFAEAEAALLENKNAAYSAATKADAAHDALKNNRKTIMEAHQNHIKSIKLMAGV